MSKILITGGAGFIGYFLAERLSADKGNRVTIIDNLSRGSNDREFKELLGRENVIFLEGDLTDSGFLLKLDKDYEYLYHLAAIIGVDNVVNNPDKVLRVNTASVLNLFEYARDIENLKRIFFSSTSEVYAGTMKHFEVEIPTDEDVALTIEDISEERSTYALTKIFGECCAFIYGKRYGLPVTVGRYHNVYGPRMGFAHVIPETFLKIAGSGTIDVPSLNHTRAFCFIDDAVEFTIRSCRNDNTSNSLLHIGNSKEEISVKDLVLKIAAVMGREITINGLADTPGSPQRRCPDTSKIERLTGYAPLVRLEEGIGRTYEWYKSRI